MASFSFLPLTVLLLACGQTVLSMRLKQEEMSEGVKNRRAALMQRQQQAAGIDEATQYHADQMNNIEHIIQEQPETPALLTELPFQQVAPTYVDDNGRTQARKDIHLLQGAMPPVWPHRLGTLKFSADSAMTVHPEDSDGLLQTNNAGTPIDANGSPCGQARQAICPVVNLEKDAPAVDLPFNTQLEDLEFRLTSSYCPSCAPPNRNKYVETDCCTYVDNFDTALFQREFKRGNGIRVGSKEVDFAVHWEVSTMNFGESIPVVAPQAFIGFGVDGSDSPSGKTVILDLGMAFYSCDDKSMKLVGDGDNLQNCIYRGMLNFETEANHAKSGLYAKPWDEFPGRKPSQKRTVRCTNSSHMCSDQPTEFSGLVFKEKVAGEMVAEYSGELIGGGGDGDDSWLYLDLEGLKKLGVTHALLTGHEYNGIELSQLTGAFYRLAAGKVVEKKGHMQTILYQDLDEAKEPPTPRFPRGAKVGSNAMLLGAFNLHGDDDWSFGPMPEAAKGGHWQYTVLNTPIKGNKLSSSKVEIANVLNRQILPVPPSEQPALNEQIGTALDLRMNSDLAEKVGDADVAYQRFPGGAPGAATRNFHFFPEASRSKVTLTKVSGATACSGKELRVAVGGKKLEASTDSLGTALFNSEEYLDVREPFGRFSTDIEVSCDKDKGPDTRIIRLWSRPFEKLVIGTLPRDRRRTLPPLVFTAPWSNFKADYALSIPDTDIVLDFAVQVLSAEW